MEIYKNASKRRSLGLSIVIFGWVLCSYLWFRSTQVRVGHGNIPDLCKIVFGNSCDQTLTSPLSWQLGIPLVGWGLAYFGILGLLLSLRKPFTDRFVIFIAAFGAGASCLLSIGIIFGGLSCPLCLGVHLINLVAFVILFWSIRPHFLASEQAQNSNGKSLIRWVGLLLVVVMLGSGAEFVALKKSINKKPEASLEEVAKNFRDARVYDIPKGDSTSMIGSNSAPVQLVVFSSFQCPACKTFAPSLENIHKQFGEKIGITFRNFPLSSTCNPRLMDDMQPRACPAAFAALAAQLQNRFWNYHDQLFQTDLTEDDSTLVSIAKNVGLNIEQWESDRQSDELKDRLSVDVNLGYELGISGTPTVFINGRQVMSFQESILSALIQNELNKILN